MYDKYFDMFTKTGEIGYYLLYREINRENEIVSSNEDPL